MRLTDIFSTDKQITDKQRVEQPDHTKTASVNRQIRSMVPGQTIQGEIISKNGGEIQLKLVDDIIMNAKLEQNMNLEIGKNMTFEVRNNGRALTLSPLFANTATAANTLKALDMAMLPVNETTVEMTKLMMDAGLSVDKNSLQQIYREINSYPDAKISDIVDLHRLSLPVNAENIEQIVSYKNLTHQITDGMTDVTNELNFVIDSMINSGDIKGAAKLYGQIMSIVSESGLMPQEEAMKVNTKIVIEESRTEAIVSMAESTGKTAAESALSLLEEIAGKNQAEGADRRTENVNPAESEGRRTENVNPAESAGRRTENVNPQEGADSRVNMASQERETDASVKLADSLSKLTGRTIPPDTDPGILIRIANETIHKAMIEHDTGMLKKLLGDDALRETVNDTLQKAWTLRPEDVADPKKVENLYDRLDRQLRSLSHALEDAGQTNQNAYKAVTNMTQNVDFLQQLNQMYAYVQLPLRLNQGNAHGDLYVYTNRKNLSSKDGKVSALLHLDMEHLGPVDVYVAMENSNVSTNFYVQDDSMLDFLSEHMDILTARLERRGYNCTFGLQVRGTDEEKEGGVKTLLKQQDGHVALAKYAFDVRA